MVSAIISPVKTEADPGPRFRMAAAQSAEGSLLRLHRKPARPPLGLVSSHTDLVSFAGLEWESVAGSCLASDSVLVEPAVFPCFVYRRSAGTS